MMSEKGFDSEPMYNEKYLKTKVKSYERKIKKHFYNGTPKEVSHCISLSVILIDSAFKMGKNYSPRVFFRRMQVHFQRKIASTLMMIWKFFS